MEIYTTPIVVVHSPKSVKFWEVLGSADRLLGRCFIVLMQLVFKATIRRLFSALEALLARTWPRGEEADAQDALAGLFVAGITAVDP